MACSSNKGSLGGRWVILGREWDSGGREWVKWLNNKGIIKITSMNKRARVSLNSLWTILLKNLKKSPKDITTKMRIFLIFTLIDIIIEKYIKNKIWISYFMSKD